MRPATSLRECDVGVAAVHDARQALMLLVNGQRSERRAAARWLQRHRDELTPDERRLLALKTTGPGKR
jgi:hypothetical protein